MPWLCPILAPHYSKHCSSGDDLSLKLSWICPLDTPKIRMVPQKKIYSYKEKHVVIEP